MNSGRLKRSYRVLLLILLAGGASVLCWALWPRSPSKAPGQGPGFNVLLITLDTTRADRLGCYGHAKASTPVLDQLAREGTLFESAMAQIPLTLPSHASLLTGLHPAELGILDNGRTALPENAQTLATILRDRGYRTGAFVAASVLDADFGLDAGFDVYDDDLPRPPMSVVQVDQERPANVVCDRALVWLEENAAGPFLCWVHFFDPHGPYEPPEPFRSQVSDPYDGELAFVDSQVARLAAWIRSRGLVERTLIVVAGDHGEGLGDHGEEAHGVFLYDATLRVPLILSMPGKVPAAAQVASVVSLVDVLPTLMDLLDLPVPESVSGVSFAQTLRGQELSPGASYARSDYALDHFGWSRLESLTTREWKYIQGSAPELYDRRGDPGEARNFILERPEVGEAMRKKLEAVARAMQTRQARETPLSDNRLKALRSLGYIGDSGGGSRDDPSALKKRRNPREMTVVLGQYFLAVELAARNELPAAISLLKEAAAASPESYTIRRLLGELQLEAGNLEAAWSELQAAGALHSDAGEIQHALGRVLKEQGRLPEAIGHYHQALQRMPWSVEVRANLGVALEDLGRVDDAIVVFRQALDLDPNHATLHNNLGKALMMKGNTDEAITHFRQAIQFQAGFAKAYSNLGAAVARKGESAEAIGYYQEAIRLDPGYSQARNNLGAAFMSLGRWAEAVEQAREAVRLAPADPIAQFNLGNALAGQGKPEEAGQAYEEALRLKPDFGEARRRLDRVRQRVSATTADGEP